LVLQAARSAKAAAVYTRLLRMTNPSVLPANASMNGLVSERGLRGAVRPLVERGLPAARHGC
jgi:hypothetical protein